MRILLMIALITCLGGSVRGQVPVKLPSCVFYSEKDQPVKIDPATAAGYTLFLFLDATCEHCQKAAAILNGNERKLAGYQHLFILYGPVSSRQRFMARHAPALAGKRNVSVLHDTLDKAYHMFKLASYPSVLLYDNTGKLVLYETNEDNLFRLWRKKVQK